VEVDEFTKEAIAAALDGIDPSLHRVTATTDLPDIVDTYRYVAERLCHRLRNAISGPSIRLRKLTSLVENVQDGAVRGELIATAGQILDSFRKVSQLVEFDVSDEYFQHRSVDLADWVKGMNNRYSATHNPVTLTIKEQPSGSKSRIRANDQHLETIFLNLWSNSTQAVQATPAPDGACRIILDIRETVDQRVEVLVCDNGPGIPGDVADALFQMSFSTKKEGRGRGPLEVQDAVRRLFGTVRLVDERPGEYRVCMSFPLEAT